MNHLKTQIIAIVIFHRLTNYFLLGSVFLCLAVYIYFANAAVRNVTSLEQFKNLKESLTAEVSDMESWSFALENNISMEKAKSLGLKEINKPLFIVKNNKSQALSLIR